MEKIEDKNMGSGRRFFSTKSKENEMISHEHLPTWEFITDCLGNYLYVSHEVNQCLGIQPDKFINQSLFTFSICPSSGEKIYKKFSKYEIPLEDDVIFVSLDNKKISCKLNLTKLLEENNNPPTYFGYIQVINVDSKQDYSNNPPVNQEKLDIGTDQNIVDIENLPIAELTSEFENKSSLQEIWKNPDPTSIQKLVDEFSTEANHIIESIELFKLCFQVLNKIFPLENILISSVNQEKDKIEIPILKNNEDIFYFYEGDEYQSVLRRILKKEPAIEISTYDGSSITSETLLNNHPVSCIESTIQFGNRTYGALLVFSEEKKEFSKKDSEVLHKISTIMGYSLENARIFNEMQNALEAIGTREKYQNLIIQAIRSIAIEEISNISKTFEVLGKITNVQRIFLAKSEGEKTEQKWVISQQWTNNPHLDTSYLNQSLPPDFSKEYIPKFEKTGFLKIDFERLDDPTSKWFEHRKTQSALIFLIFSDYENEALLVLEDVNQHHIWKNEEINFLKIFSEIIGERLYTNQNELHIRRKWMEGERFHHIINTLGKLDFEKNKIVDISFLLNNIENFLTKELYTKSTIIYLDNIDNSIEIDPEVLQVSSLILEVINDGKQKCFVASQSSPNFNTASITTTKIISPIIIKGNIEGVSLFIYDKKLTINDQLGFYHQILTDQIAMLLNNFYLFQKNLQLQRKLDEATKLNEKFISNISHEFRTPLNSIIGFSKVIQTGIDGPVNETQKQDLALIHSSGQSLLKMINDILDYAQIEAGIIQMDKSKVDLETLISQLKKDVEEMIKDKVLEFKINMENNLPDFICDKARIYQVIINMISNAIKNTEIGKITLSIKKKPKTLSSSDLIFLIKDTGRGISQEDQKLLFRSFTQLKENDKSRSASSGLGLVLSKAIIDNHGGKIGLLRSVPGEGSEFYFTLPIK